MNRSFSIWFAKSGTVRKFRLLQSHNDQTKEDIWFLSNQIFKRIAWTPFTHNRWGIALNKDPTKRWITFSLKTMLRTHCRLNIENNFLQIFWRSYNQRICAGSLPHFPYTKSKLRALTNGLGAWAIKSSINDLDVNSSWPAWLPQRFVQLWIHGRRSSQMLEQRFNKKLTWSLQLQFLGSCLSTTFWPSRTARNWSIGNWGNTS